MFDNPDGMNIIEASALTNQPEISLQEWAQLCERYANGCALCGKSDGLVPDLVIPLRLGGALGADNVQPLCVPCRTLKREHLVDYRPYEPLSSACAGKLHSPEVAADPNCATLRSPVAKLVTQRHLLAIEHRYFGGDGDLIEDPIMEYDVAAILVAELQRVRALIILDPIFARVESQAWIARYASLMPGPKRGDNKGYIQYVSHHG
jgi:hypothetical protein